MDTQIALPLEVLEAPFPDDLVKSRPGAFGNSLSYIEGHTVIARLNEAFEGNWSFTIESHQILDEEVLVCGKFRADVAGIVKMAFGSSSITRDKRTGSPVNMGDDLKAAATDALKKAATLLGVGLYLYGTDSLKATPGDERSFEEELRRPAPSSGNGQRRTSRTPEGNHSQGNGQGRITNKQISAIFAIARDRGMSNADVRSLCRELCNRTVDYLSKAEASRVIEHLLDR